MGYNSVCDIIGLSSFV